MRCLCLISVLASLALPAPAQALSANDARFYERKEEGWFWYNEEIEPEKKEKKEPEKKPKAKSAPTPEVVKTEPSTAPAPQSQGPPPFSAQWFRENLSKYRDRAIDDPSPENVRAYFLLQRIMMDKATRFTDAARQVVMGDPLLDEMTRRPTATYAVHEVDRQAQAGLVKALKAIAKKAGIFFFFRHDCPYCHKEAPVLRRLAELYGFHLIPISIDGKPLPDNLTPDYRVDNGLGARLSVARVPAVFLAAPPNTYIAISQGLLSMTQLQQRLLLGGFKGGLIDKATYDAARPFVQPDLLDAARIPSPTTDVDALLKTIGGGLK